MEHHSVVIGANGRIEDILPTEMANKKYDADTVIHKSRHALIPGLINSHNHAPMALFRGFADDLPLVGMIQEWTHNRRHAGCMTTSSQQRASGYRQLLLGLKYFQQFSH
jgi:5-methylthioadenosine/S-adenosylhomocysteine deaminase